MSTTTKRKRKAYTDPSPQPRARYLDVRAIRGPEHAVKLAAPRGKP